MPNGGTLTLETGNVDLDDEYARRHPPARRGPYVMVVVSDTGVGMDEATQAKVFEPFFTTKALGKGTGLGLATVYGIIKQSAGFIWVYSEPGYGTTFRIYLPRYDAAPTATEKAEAAPPVSTHGSEAVLVVEDQEPLRELIREMLEEKGYTVMVAQDGAAALDLVRSRPDPVHLLLADVVMPGMNGHELAERMAADRPGLSVLFMSGYTNGAVTDRGMLHPGAVLLEKPFTGEGLLQAVRKALDKG